MGRRIEIFWEREFSGLSDSLRNEMAAKVGGETTDYLLNVDEQEYSQHLLELFTLEPLQIHFDDLYATTREENIPAARHPRFTFNVRNGASYPRQVIKYHIPYGGTEELLRCTPNPRIMTTEEVELQDGCICFDVIDFYNDPEGIKREADQIIGRIRQQLEHLKKNVEDHNNKLPNELNTVISHRKEQLQKQLGVLHGLGVPIKKSADLPETFRVPTVRREVMPRPSVPQGMAEPEPTLGDNVYQEILQVIHDMGKVFERLPSTYVGKDEETLRDHIILYLEPRFDGGTTGETFNKTGKTDILIRHENANIFVAECKYWSGGKNHLATIDQLLRYLTWRDSKAAIVCFVTRKDFTAVLKQLEDVTKEHPCYVSYRGAKEETWLDFEFRLPGDEGRTIKVAILAFHLPQ